MTRDYTCIHRFVPGEFCAHCDSERLFPPVRPETAGTPTPPANLVGEVWKFTRHSEEPDNCVPASCTDPTHYFYEVVGEPSAAPSREAVIEECCAAIDELLALADINDSGISKAVFAQRNIERRAYRAAQRAIRALSAPATPEPPKEGK